ncbi:MAG: MopE-related protein [Bacteroidota bacterium]
MSGQVRVDMTKSVPIWLEYEGNTGEAELRWLPDSLGFSYEVGVVSYTPSATLSSEAMIDSNANGYSLGVLEPGVVYEYQVKKTIQGGPMGLGVIAVGVELPLVHQRGRCLLVIEDTLVLPLQVELAQLSEDMAMDGWAVESTTVSRGQGVGEVKSLIADWYEEEYAASQAVLLLGHVPVPYSGNRSYDGHTDHQGAWAADVFYAEMDGNWTDEFVDNTSPSRPVNDNVPGDGKFDQSSIPGPVELEVGRVDFNNLPAFAEGEIELMRTYLNKNHAFRIGQKRFKRRAIIENNFPGLTEGFGQSGWRNFVPMFGGSAVKVGNYDVEMDTANYLCSYACGGGSYTSASGIGSTANLWAAKDLQTVFTMTFGSYFGDWDSQNNFLRSALASGDILTNAWSGRPIWQLYPMAQGAHIGFCTRRTQNASTLIYGNTFGTRSTHIALMGDPTLRLHPLRPAADLMADTSSNDILLSWQASADAELGYHIYRRINGEPQELLAAFHTATSFSDPCYVPNADYEYIVKAVRLEQTGSGSYYNSSQGIGAVLSTGENSDLVTFYADSDMDGFGDAAVDTLACAAPPGFVADATDCNDENPDIFPGATEILNNGIDEDCDGEDLLTSLHHVARLSVSIYPNPVSDWLYLQTDRFDALSWRLLDARGQQQEIRSSGSRLDLRSIPAGAYWLEIQHLRSGDRLVQKIIVQR